MVVVVVVIIIIVVVVVVSTSLSSDHRDYWSKTRFQLIALKE